MDKLIGKLIHNIAATGASKASGFYNYQPKVPAKLVKEKNSANNR